MLTRAAAMEPRRSKRIKLSKEGDFGVLLGALMRDVPDLFEAEVLSKLDVKDHFRLAQVNKACRDVVYKLGPVEFMRSCDVSDKVDRLRSRRLDATVEGRLDVLKWLWKHNGPYHLLSSLMTADFCGWIQADIYYAGLHGHRHVLDWYLTLPRDGLDRRVVQTLDQLEGACDGAAAAGKLELLKYLRAKGAIFSATTCVMAAGKGQLHIIKWLRENGCPWNERTPGIAAFKGQLSALKWARENACPWDTATCAVAALGGKLEILMWLRAHGCPWDEITCAEAAEGGHLEVLQWAHENGCPWNAGTCYSAALGGKLEILMWLRAHGCPWDETTCAIAGRGAYLDVLQWAHENGCPWDEEALDVAIECGSWTCLKYLVDNKCPGVNEEIMEWYEEHCK